jgi:hypothetical protein
LLRELANLTRPISSSQIRHFADYYPEVFERIANDEEGLRDLLDILSRFLQLAWHAKNARERNWHLFTVRQEYVRGLLGTHAMLTRDGVVEELSPEKVFWVYRRRRHSIWLCVTRKHVSQRRW